MCTSWRKMCVVKLFLFHVLTILKKWTHRETWKKGFRWRRTRSPGVHDVFWQQPVGVRYTITTVQVQGRSRPPCVSTWLKLPFKLFCSGFQKINFVGLFLCLSCPCAFVHHDLFTWDMKTRTFKCLHETWKDFKREKKSYFWVCLLNFVPFSSLFHSIMIYAFVCIICLRDTWWVPTFDVHRFPCSS
jgi:hypothetical protein